MSYFSVNFTVVVSLFGLECRNNSIYIPLPFKQFNICSFFLLAGFDFNFRSLGKITTG